jgi:hypothetical protein
MLATTASPLRPGQLLLDPGQVLGTVFSMPWVSLILAAIIAVGITVTPRWRARTESRVRLAAAASGGVFARYSPEHRTLGVAAIAVIVIFVAENLITGYGVDLHDVVSWWRYATPVFTAGVAVTILLTLIATRGSTPPERPVFSARRTWLSFSPRIGAVGAAATLLALTVTTLLAGLASSNIDGGPYVFLEIDVPNETIDPIRPWFYGWAYGVPVLICTAALIAVAIAALRANAVRPFLRPETIVAEQRERRDIATGITRIATSAAILALAGAWRFIADAGSINGLTIQGDGRSDSYDTFWRYGEVAAVGGWLAPALEITAFVLLLLTTAQLCPPRHDLESAVDVENSAERESAR